MAMRPLPDADTVLRYVAYGRCAKDEDGNVIGVLPQAFALREGESHLSVTWVEHFGANHGASIPMAVRAFRASLDSKAGAKSVFAQGKVDAIKAAGLSKDVKLRVLHRPTKPNPGHAGIDGFNNNHQDLQELLAAETCSANLISNVSIPE